MFFRLCQLSAAKCLQVDLKFFLLMCHKRIYLNLKGVLILKGCKRISIGIEEKVQKLHNLAEALETELINKRG